MVNPSSKESAATFWLPCDHVREVDRVLGTIETTSDDIKLTLQGRTLFNQVELIPELRKKWAKRVVGTIATDTYVSISDCRRIGVQLYTVEGPPQVTFRCSGTGSRQQRSSPGGSRTTTRPRTPVRGRRTSGVVRETLRASDPTAPLGNWEAA